MKFFSHAIASLTRKSFYQDILDGKVGMGFGYVAVLEVLATLFIVFLVSINISSFLPVIDSVAKDILPPGAEIIIKDSKLRANVNPIVIPMPAKATGGSPEHKNLLVLDTTTSLTIEDLKRKDTFLLINSDGMIAEKDNGTMQINTFSQVPDLDVSIDQEWFTMKASWVKSHAKYVPFILFLPILAGFYLLALFWSLIYGLATYVFLRVYKLNTPFKRAYSVGLYSRTFGLIFTLLVFVVPILNMAYVAFLLNILFIFYMIKPVSSAVPVPGK